MLSAKIKFEGEVIEITESGDKLLSESIKSFREKINAKLTEFCEIEKANKPKQEPPAKKAKSNTEIKSNPELYRGSWGAIFHESSP
jgi:hypothetical protein